MPDKISTKRATERDDHQGDNNHRQHSMSKENGEVQRPCKALSGKSRGAVLKVIREIGTEEGYRNDQR